MLSIIDDAEKAKYFYGKTLSYFGECQKSYVLYSMAIDEKLLFHRVIEDNSGCCIGAIAFGIVTRRINNQHELLVPVLCIDDGCDKQEVATGVLQELKKFGLPVIFFSDNESFVSAMSELWANEPVSFLQ